MSKDLFSSQAQLYAQYRPNYPKELFEYISKNCINRHRVWDCAAGNGQASLHLAKYFSEVIASDLSEKQISHAKQHPNIQYRVAPAEHSQIEANSVDCITVAQALHWFDNDEFYNEVKRVAKNNATIAVWGYDLPHCDDEIIHNILLDFYKNTLGNYWAPERRHIDEHYQNLYFPFANVNKEKFYTHKNWDLNEFLGYLSTWSAVQTYQEQNHQNPIDLFFKQLLVSHWNKPKIKKNFRIEIFMLSASI